MTGPYFQNLRRHNALLGWPRVTPLIRWSGGNWRPEYPAGNSGTLPLKRVARSADLAPASTKLVGVWSQPASVGVVTAVDHNWSIPAQWRLRLFGDETGARQVFEKPRGPVWQIAYSPDSLRWEDPNFWTGTLSQSDLQGLSWNARVLIEPPVMARRIEIEIWDEGNPAGFLQHGLIEVADILRFPVNFGFGAEAGPRSRSLRVEAESGALYFERRTAPRFFNGSVTYAPADWASSRFSKFVREADSTEPFWWDPIPLDVQETHRLGFFGRWENLSSQRLAFARRRSLQLNFQEAL